jgi:hypothetical protein
MQKMVEEGELKYDEQSKRYTAALVESVPAPPTDAEVGFM